MTKINKLDNAIHGTQSDLDTANKKVYLGTEHYDVPQSNRTSRRAYSDSGDGIDGYWEE